MSLAIRQANVGPADRDPEAEAEEKVDEDKIADVEEPVAAIESGFGAGGDWDAAPAGFAGATGTWDGAGDEWGAAPTTAPVPTVPNTEWTGEAKESTW